MKRLAPVGVALVGGGAIGHVQEQAPAPAPRLEAENFSPLGFEDLRAYQQAFPGMPGTLAVANAAALKYWVFRGIAYRGSLAGEGPAWLSLGPMATTDG